ncbi:MAG TPA: helix-turn-helix transcriptional regulator [Propionibacterium sp.]|jgi:transcriptional regulator with XRE-family HTH domain|nr:helix-turn-helix transcriptional regulator [Propionibacterium sp.]
MSSAQRPKGPAVEATEEREKKARPESLLNSPSMGSFIRAQRQLSAMSLRQLAALSNVSNAYLSQIERGLHQPSLKVVRSIAEALNISTEYLLSQSGVLEKPEPSEQTSAETAILNDPVLTDEEKDVVLGVYRSLRQRHSAR